MPASRRDDIVVCDPFGRTHARLVLAASRAGALGVLDLGPEADASEGERGDGGHWLGWLAEHVRGGWAVRVPPGWAADLPAAADTVIVSGPDSVTPVDIAQWSGRRVLVEVTTLAEAEAAARAGADGLVAKGSESGGRVGSVEGLILAQQVRRLALPWWMAGGVGPHTAAAPVAAGASGVVLSDILALVDEVRPALATRVALSGMDATDTRVVGGYQVWSRPGTAAASVSSTLTPGEVRGRLGADVRRDLVPAGPDTALAARIADRWRGVAGVVAGMRERVATGLDAARRVRPLAPGRRLARRHGLGLPIAQGPMTRVSDRPAFAAAVADAGGLPFLALALLGESDVRRLLVETAQALGERPWGVGILGFVPPDVRAAQLSVVEAVRPPFAIIAGGRPAQARSLEQAGITTFIHVPSPGLLRQFLDQGARRFVFEGRECGGHVGPRTSLALWEAQLGVLDERPDVADVEILLAGGIHDSVSAAAAAAVLAPLAARGAGVGVLMGTAYLFTAEAVASGAIMAGYQHQALECAETVLLETSPGHATRCVQSPYVRAFDQRKAELVRAGVEPAAMWAELEQLNLGRLRMASKGIARTAEGLQDIDADTQAHEGMFMIGQVASLRQEPTTIADLHEDVSLRSDSVVDEAAARLRPATVRPRERPPLDIAIIGMAGVFPQAGDVEEFWSHVVDGVDAITEVPPERWTASRYYDPDATGALAGRKTPSRWGGFVPASEFDPLAFGIPPASLGAIEPVQLLAVAVAARALADAGYATRPFDRERTSVVFGAEGGTDLQAAYNFRSLADEYLGALPPELQAYLPVYTEDSFPGVLTNVIAGRIANRLDLGGVNYTVDAACASSLAALDAACKELVAGGSQMVICGGADLHNGINDYLLFSSVRALSPSGRSRPFDADSDGISLGEAVGCLVLKRLADAQRDGDRVYAVLDAVCGSSDGRHLGLTAPRKEGQQLALDRAYRQAGFGPESIGLVEAHGTGTVVGDRTELATLTETYAQAGARPGATVLGSVKSQVGHTKCAAGVVGLVKIARSVYHGVLPPTLNIQRPHENWDAASSPFRFLTAAQPWADEVRHAAVSAFGFGGSNFHAVVSSAPEAEPPAHGVDPWPAELVVVRAASLADARTRAGELAGLCEAVVASDPAGRRHRLRDLAYTVSAGAAWPHEASAPVRIAVVASDWSDLAAKLRAVSAGQPGDGVFVAGDAPSAGRVAFVYPGQGSQRPGMLGDLFVAFPWLHPLLRQGRPWLPVLFPGGGHSAEERATQLAAITATENAQPTLGIAEAAATALWSRLGVLPDAAAGHSYGELPALAAAGCFDTETLLALSAARARAMTDAVAAIGGDPGTMAAVSLGADELRRHLPDLPGVVVANENSPRQSVIAGPSAAVAQAVDALRGRGIGVRPLTVGCAFHSPVIAGAGTRLAARLAEAAIGEPRIPVVSCSTATRYPDDPEKTKVLLAEALGSPVRWVDQVEALYDEGVRTFVEVGPGRVLTQLVGAVLGERAHVAVATDVPGEPGITRLLLSCARLATTGVDIDPEVLFAGRARAVELSRLPLPRPGWTVDGHLVRTADGAVVAGALQPANSAPELSAMPQSAVGALASAEDSREQTVLGYLEAMRAAVAAQRDVMLQYLGDTVATARPAAVEPVAPAEVAAGVDVVAAVQAASTDPGTSEPPAEEHGTDLLALLIEIVSERTGYPSTMLDPDADLEADLSIDSIKRLEVLTELVQRGGVGAADSADSIIEQVGRIKTLRGVVQWLDENAPGSRVSTTPADSPALTCRVLETVDAPALAETLSLPGLRVAVVPDAGPPVADRVVDLLTTSGAQVVAAAAVRESDAVLYLGALDPSAPADACASFAGWRAAATGGTATRWVAASVDGGFTAGPREVSVPTGLGGLLATAALEVPGLSVRHVDLDSDLVAADPSQAARLLVAELRDVAGPLEVAWRRGRRTTTRLAVRDDHGGPAAASSLQGLNADSVVLLTGGARGITAAVTRRLSERFGCALEVVGRTRLDVVDDPGLAAAADLPALRRLLASSVAEPDLARIDARARAVLARREIWATLNGVTAHGGRVRYHALDVSDDEALGALVTDVYARHGRLDAVVHGAGIIDDKLLGGKTPESFAAVYATKVAAARTLLRHLRPGPGVLVFYGSLSGVVGNRGQVDYASANSALDSLSRRHDGDGGWRVVSLDWGPWRGAGMVTDSLERAYAQRGIDLIDVDEGVSVVLEALHNPARFAPQTIVTAGALSMTRVGAGRGSPLPSPREPVAIVGMACVLPGAGDLDAFWANVLGGVDAITDAPAQRWDPVFYDPVAGTPDRFYCRRGGFVDSVAVFDPTEFGIMPLAVDGAEPDQLLALAVAARALADAGDPHRRLDPNRVGVILGRGGYTGSGQRRLEQRVHTAEQLVVSLQALLPELDADRLAAVKSDFVRRLGPARPESAIDRVPNLTASRVSNRLNLRGPSHTVDAACASSLVAVDQAMDQLESRRCDVVLAGGVHHCHDLTLWSVFTQLGAISRSQQLRAFDRRADGLLIGEGTVMFVLRRLSDAEADGDRVYAVIRASGIASDGRATSLMSPSVEGQVLALERAWAGSGREPARIGLIEAHGTGTPTGDEVELQTLRRVFGPAERGGERAGLGSVKSMIGHAMPAAGAAGLAKAALAVFHGVLPPTLHVEEPSAAVGQTRFRLIAASEPWESPAPRLAGVDAFGFGGINAHLVLEEHSASTGRTAAGHRHHPKLSPVAGREIVLRVAGANAAEVADRLRLIRAEDVGGRPDSSTDATLVSHGSGPCRLAVVAPTPKRLQLAAAVVERGHPFRGRDDVWFQPAGMLGPESGGGLLAFVFPGLEPDFRPRLDDVARLVGFDARRVVGDATRLEVLGPAVIDAGRIVDAALERAGVRPDLCAGHSVGEWTAQVATGMTPADALEPLLDRLGDDGLSHPDVAYVALGCGVDRALALIDGVPDVEVSHDNCPHQTVVCGTDEATAVVRGRAAGQGLIAQEMPFRSGFHTSMFAPYLEGMRAMFGSLPIRRPRAPVWSATTAEPYPDDADAVRALTIEHLTRPVGFRRLITRLHEHGARVFVEVGVGSLTGFVDDILGDLPHLSIATTARQRPGLAQLRRALAALWSAGAEVSFDALTPAGSVTRPATGSARRPLRLGAPLVRGLTPLSVAGSAPLRSPAPVGSHPVLQAFQASIDEATRASQRVLERWAPRAPAAPSGSPALAPVSTSPAVRELVRPETFSLSGQPAWSDHAIFSQPAGWADQSDRFPIVPLTAMIERFVELAREVCPSLIPVGLEDVRASRWLVVEPETTVTTRALAGDGERADGLVAVRVSIDGHARATVLLADRYPTAPDHTRPDARRTRRLPFTAQEIYSERWLFHGPAYQGIETVLGWDDTGIDGEVVALPAPGALLDNAGQVFGLWVALALDDRRTVLPTTVRRVTFHGPPPSVGARLRCRADITSVDRDAVVADLQLAGETGVWARLEGWTERRFDVTNRLFELIRSPQDHVVAEVTPHGWAWVQETWLDPASREMTMRRYLNALERADYGRRNPRAQRAMLLGRVAVKDLLRQRRWNRGAGPIFPAEITVRNEVSGRPWVSGVVEPGVQVSLAHSDGIGVAICSDNGPVGIDVEVIGERSDRFADAVLTDNERAVLDVAAGSADAGLTTAWTLKEAAAKAAGTGLAGRPKAFEVVERDGDRYRIGDRWLAVARLSPPPMAAHPERKEYVVAWTTPQP